MLNSILQRVLYILKSDNILAALIMKPVSVLQIDCLVSRILERTESCLKNPQDSAKLQFFLKNPSAVSEVFDRDDYFEVPDLACGVII